MLCIGVNKIKIHFDTPQLCCGVVHLKIVFFSMLSFKAEWAGKKVVKINPAHTSQTCSRCGNRHKLKLSDRIYHCPCCDLSLNRDHNAAINILGLGMQSIDRSLAVS